MTTALNSEVRLFIAEHFQSPEPLEVMLLLLAEPTREFRPAEVARHLDLEPDVAGDILMSLYAQGLVAITSDGDGAPRGRFAPRSPRLAELAAKLADAFAHQRRVVLRELMTAQGGTGPVRSFAEAFRLKPRGKHG